MICFYFMYVVSKKNGSLHWNCIWCGELSGSLHLIDSMPSEIKSRIFILLIRWKRNACILYLINFGSRDGNPGCLSFSLSHVCRLLPSSTKLPLTLFINSRCYFLANQLKIYIFEIWERINVFKKVQEDLETSYAPNLIQQMEVTVLKSLEWRLNSITPFSYVYPLLTLLTTHAAGFNKQDLINCVTQFLLHLLSGIIPPKIKSELPFYLFIYLLLLIKNWI